jgi:urease accessory protein
MNGTAMHCEVRIRVAVRNGMSYLASSYFTPPLKVADVSEDRSSGELHLMLMSSSPGVLDGDVISIVVDVEAGGSLRLGTQSYQRLFRMLQGAAQGMEVRVGHGGSFCWLPHPCVPHAHAIYKATNRVFLSAGCRLVWGEILTCGRKLNGEVFGFSKYHVRTEVYVGEQLALIENVCLQPGLRPVEGLGQMEGFTHQGSLLYIGDGLVQKRAEAETCLSGVADIIYGISEGPASSLVIRILGNKAEPLYDMLKEVARCLFSKAINHAS